MSVVIAIKDKDRIIVGCDSQVSSWNRKYKLKGKSQKIFEIKNCEHGIIGGVGRLRGLQLIQAQDELIDELKQYKNEINLNYCVLDLYDKIYSIFQRHNMIQRDLNGNLVPWIDCEFIFAYKDQAFTICDDGSVEEIDDFLVIGSGEEVARGILSNNKHKHPIERIYEAIKSCSDNTLYVDDNVLIKDTYKPIITLYADRGKVAEISQINEKTNKNKKDDGGN